MLRWNANYVLQNHHSRPHGYTPLAFKADEMKQVIQEMMYVRMNFHNTGRTYLIKVCPGLSQFVRIRLSDFQALVPYITPKGFICAPLNPNTTQCLTAEQELSYTCPQASLLRLNMTSAIGTRTLTHAHAGTV